VYPNLDWTDSKAQAHCGYGIQTLRKESSQPTSLPESFAQGPKLNSLADTDVRAEARTFTQIGPVLVSRQELGYR
jgi:hypothetical protein